MFGEAGDLVVELTLEVVGGRLELDVERSGLLADPEHLAGGSWEEAGLGDWAGRGPRPASSLRRATLSFSFQNHVVRAVGVLTANRVGGSGRPAPSHRSENAGRTAPGSSGSRGSPTTGIDKTRRFPEGPALGPSGPGPRDPGRRAREAGSGRSTSLSVHEAGRRQQHFASGGGRRGIE